jgi:hypothetical protein
MSFGATISELIQQQGKEAAASRVEAGRIAANALTSNAQAASEATKQKGLIWGGAINQIGQSIGAIPGQIQHAKALDLQQQDMTAQIAERQAKVKKEQDAEAESAAVDAAFAASVKPDGSVDTQKFLAGVPGSKQQIYAPMVETLNKNAKAMQDAKDSSIAHGLYAAYRDGTPESLVNVGKMMVGSKAMQPEELAQLQQVADAIKSSPSETQKASVQTVAAHLGSSFPQFSDLLDKGRTQEAALAETAAKTNEANARAAELSRPQLPTEASLAAAANPGNPAGAVSLLKTNPAAEETARHNKEMERIDALREGKQAAAEVETARHNKAMEAHAATTDKLTKVEHKDPETGRTVIEWLPQSEIKGKTFQKGTSGATETRLASAEAVNQTGKDIIAKLSDPAFASKVGPVMGRFDKLRDFIGNPPPEYAELAGQIESYALANMGVHGMRSAEGAKQIAKLLEAHHTPASLIATINGLNGFSTHFMENEGRTTPAAPATPAKTGKVGKYGYAVQ